MTKPMSDSGKGSYRRNEDLNKVNEGFDRIFGPSKLEQRLKKQQEESMIDEQHEQDFEDIDEEYDDTCTWCGGCGEGDYDGAACRHCHGTGIEPSDKVDDDYV